MSEEYETRYIDVAWVEIDSTDALIRLKVSSSFYRQDAMTSNPDEKPFVVYRGPVLQMTKRDVRLLVKRINETLGDA